MKFTILAKYTGLVKTGDRVAVVDDQLQGIVTRIKGRTVTIEDEHGFTYDFDAHELALREAAIYEKVIPVFKEEAPRLISKKHVKKPIILDLHFEQIEKTPGKFDSFERLFRQKEKLLTTLEYCRQNHLKKLEIIHGIGDGTLQKMVYDVLEAQTDLEFHNREILHDQSGTVLVFFR